MSRTGDWPYSRVGFQFDLFGGLPLTHGMSVRVAGAPSDNDIAYTDETEPDGITRNRTAFLEQLGIDTASLTLGKQVHGSKVVRVTASDRGRGQPPDFDGFPDTDALITDVPGVALGVIVADCVPLVLYDPLHHALGVVHAGWRGTVKLTAARAVEALEQAFGSRPGDILAGIGPSIGPYCYEVGDEVIAAWREAGIDPAGAAVLDRGRGHLDLWKANRLALESTGVAGTNIETSNVCVHCESTRFFSHRAAMAGDAPRGRMLMVARLDSRPEIVEGV